MKNALQKNFLKKVRRDAEVLAGKLKSNKLLPPRYNNKTYYKDLTKSEYFDALILLRHYIKAASDIYFGQTLGAKNVDLFMITPSVSSPMGPGSDSEVIPIKFGRHNAHLVDSSQFGFEPLLFQNHEKVYCYLPSMRGEKPDARHLNQFFHCEAEIVGTLEDLIPVIEGYIRALAEVTLALEPVVSKMSLDYSRSKEALSEIILAKSFGRVSFEDAFERLRESKGTTKYTKRNRFGRSTNSDGEKFLSGNNTKPIPLWIHSFDRDIVAFYQKPNPENPNTVVNADLVFPPLTENGFGGEIAGSGQRQDSVDEIRESLVRQGIDLRPYNWYIDLRRSPNYRTTSGFGLGIERFIAWLLGYESIRDVILYPRLKNVQTAP